MDMAQDVLYQLRCLRRGLGEMLANPFGPVVERHGGGQMVERVLADEADQVFGGIELGGINWGVEETHGHPLGQGDLRQ